MSQELIRALERLLAINSVIAPDSEQRHAIVLDLLWKLSRRDYHGVADCAMDLRELRL